MDAHMRVIKAIGASGYATMRYSGENGVTVLTTTIEVKK
jgi:hypothetical protein